MTKKTNKQGMTPAEIEEFIKQINPERHEYVKRFGCFGRTATGQPIEWISKQEFMESEKQTALRKKREARRKKKRQEMIKKYKQCEVTIHAHYTVTLEPDEVAQYEKGTPITEFDGWNDELVHIEVYDIKPTDAV